MATVSVEGIRKDFGAGRPVLDGISIAAADGEFVALLGGSGCGKTTLLRIIAGLETPDSGRVFIGGRDVTELAPKDRDIAMVFQSYALYPHLKVADNIGLGLKIRGVGPAERSRRVNDAASMLGIESLLDRRPAALSGGQRQRVALARALVRRPMAYLLDEPLSNLDAVLRERTRGELKLLFRRVVGTVLYVTHDQTEALTLSDRIVVLDAGRIRQVGSPSEIYHRPANTFVASFVGSPPMNLLPVEEAARLGIDAAAPDGRRQGAVVGIRPEDVAVSPAARDGFLRLAVQLAEPVGASTILTLAASAGAGPAEPTLRASVPGDWTGGTEAWARPDSARFHFFDSGTRARISGAGLTNLSPDSTMFP